MILGASHMTLACTDLDQGMRDLEKVGYRTQFVERDLPNDPSKAPFLSKQWTSHAICYAKPERGLPIELVRYDSELSGAMGRYVGVFDRPTPAASAPRCSGAKAIDTPFGRCERGSIEGFGVPAVFKAEESSGGLIAAMLATHDLAAAVRFWTSLGFRSAKDAGGDNVRLDFVSPVAGWRFSLLLRRDLDPAPDPHLDAPGMTCLSFVSTDIASDSATLLTQGARSSTGKFLSRVNARWLNVEILHGPDGEYVELIQVETAERKS